MRGCRAPFYPFLRMASMHVQVLFSGMMMMMIVILVIATMVSGDVGRKGATFFSGTVFDKDVAVFDKDARCARRVSITLK